MANKVLKRLNIVKAYADMSKKDVADLQKWIVKHGYSKTLLKRFSDKEIKEAWDLMLNRTDDQRDLEEWFMFLVSQ